MSMIDNLEAMLKSGEDNALLRYSLGQAYLKEEQFDAATRHLALAVAQDPTYSAAWKLFGKALTGLERFEEAMTAYEKGIAAAEAKGDVQAAKEMTVFLKRLQKQAPE